MRLWFSFLEMSSPIRKPILKISITELKLGMKLIEQYGIRIKTQQNVSVGEPLPTIENKNDS